MSQTLRLFILAGEPSGDRIAADLVVRLRQQVHVLLSGIGGDELIGQGLDPLFPMSDLSVMGVTDVLRSLPRLLWRLEQTARAILRSKPDLVVLVDAQDFSKLLARRLRRSGFAGKIVLYVAPSVWARNPERAPKLRPLFDAVLAVLPFEPRIMNELGGPPTTYVGHPALGESLDTAMALEAGPVILLPGSREGELKRHLPVLKEVVAEIATLPEVTGFVLPTLPRLAPRLQTEVAGWASPVTVVSRREDRQQLYGRALAAICVSGTVTLELALARVPMAVIYALDGHQARVYVRLGRPDVSLPNIILSRPAVPEIVAMPLQAQSVIDVASALIVDKKARQRQLDAFGQLHGLMVTGEPSYGRQDPAERVLSLWRAQREPMAS